MIHRITVALALLHLCFLIRLVENSNLTVFFFIFLVAIHRESAIYLEICRALLTQEGRFLLLLLLLLLLLPLDHHGFGFLFNHPFTGVGSTSMASCLLVFSPLHSLFCNFSLFLSNPTLLRGPLRYHRTGISPNSTGIHHLKIHRLQGRLLYRWHCNSRPKLVSLLITILKVCVVSNPEPVCNRNRRRVQG